MSRNWKTSCSFH